MEPDILVDLINFHVEDTKAIVEAFRGSRLSHYLFCSSIRAHGRAELLPVDPDCLKDIGYQPKYSARETVEISIQSYIKISTK